MQQLELFEPSGSPLVPVLTELEPDTMALSDWACDNFPHNYDFEVKIVNGEPVVEVFRCFWPDLCSKYMDEAHPKMYDYIVEENRYLK
jgi:hypothetical protein